MEALKRSSNTTLVGIICFHLSSVNIEYTHTKSANISTITLQCGSPFSRSSTATLWTPFNGCQSEKMFREK